MCKGTIIYRGTTQFPVNKISTDTFRYVTYTRRQCLLRQNSGTLFIIHRSSFIQQCSSRGKFGYLSERKEAHSRRPLLSDRKQYLKTRSSLLDWLQLTNWYCRHFFKKSQVLFVWRDFLNSPLNYFYFTNLHFYCILVGKRNDHPRR